MTIQQADVARGMQAVCNRLVWRAGILTNSNAAIRVAVYIPGHDEQHKGGWSQGS